MMASRQLRFGLHPKDFFSIRYLISHSGIADAITRVEDLLAECLHDRTKFSLLLFEGPAGVGKSHLIGAYSEQAFQLGMSSQSISIVNLSVADGNSIDDNTVSHFVSEWERLKRSGGLLFAEARTLTGPGMSPHLSSRLQAGIHCPLQYPNEKELSPLISSLLERHHLRLPQANIDYLIRLLPRNPLSLENIVAAISEESFSVQKSARRPLIRSVIKRDQGIS